MPADFLRFTLSDGAGAVVMEQRPRRDGALSLRVDWIDIVSLADRFDPCMWAGATAEGRTEPEGAWSRAAPRRPTPPAPSPCSRTSPC